MSSEIVSYDVPMSSCNRPRQAKSTTCSPVNNPQEQFTSHLQVAAYSSHLLPTPAVNSVIVVWNFRFISFRKTGQFCLQNSNTNSTWGRKPLLLEKQFCSLGVSHALPIFHVSEDLRHLRSAGSCEYFYKGNIMDWPPAKAEKQQLTSCRWQDSASKN